MYQNQDLEADKFFLDTETRELVDLRAAMRREISREIYFRPSNWPLISNNDFLQGSAWKDLVCPSASWRYGVGPATDALPVPAYLGLAAYHAFLYDRINHNIAKIYQHHDQAVLFYSGGIDSMVCLSAIIYQGLLNRTQLVTFENLTQSHASCLHVNDQRKSAVQELLKRLQNKMISHDWLRIVVGDVVEVFNQGSAADLRCYATATMLDRFNNSALIFGHHGNQTLLHKHVFIDEILLRRPQLRHTLPGDDQYMPGVRSLYNQRQELVPLHRCHMLMKPWSQLSNKNQNHIYGPLGDHDIFDALRRIDFSRVDIGVISDAHTAREFLAIHTPGLFDDLITQESVKDYDNLEHIEIPRSCLDPKLLQVPQGLRHDPEGVQWLQEQIDQQVDNLPINTLVSLKNFHHMASL